MVGAAGTAAALGVTELDAEDELLVPTALVAVIEKVYACPPTKEPVTEIGEVVPEYVSAMEGEDVIV